MSFIIGGGKNMNFFNKLQVGLEKIVGPFATMVANSKYIKALTEGFMYTMPITLGVAVIAVLSNLPIDPWVDFLNSTGSVSYTHLDVYKRQKYMKATILAEDTDKHKPDPTPLLECLKKLQLQPDEVIYIGDAKSDELASKNAHIDFGYAKWGNVAQEEMKDATIVLEKPLDLLQLI